MIGSAAAGGPAYLLAWERLPGGAWGARIAWIEVGDDAGDGRVTQVVTQVSAEDITRLDGQDYSGVPRHDATPPPAPPSSQQPGPAGS
ncbi:hypothetical protein [Actinomadura macrotermitis]|uniref:Uncharacterized protein n=1 Tax=Actinomadura macrotermitis TaxID=2585200 RepID=A0A7K0C5Y3_9ACTN|nr:hypothetical protein [Actinomadura macrotermitis]MQY08746.1 hypothetical protein [Actinomadura macrotermitis]